MFVSLVNYNKYNFVSDKDILSKSKKDKESFDLLKKQSRLIEQEYSSFLKTQKLYSLGFNGGAPKSIYVIDEDLNYRKFKNQRDAARQLGMEDSINPIASCIKGRKKSHNNLYFVKALEIESENPDGTKYVDEKKV